jgi:hypothetical protein
MLSFIARSNPVVSVMLKMVLDHGCSVKASKRKDDDTTTISYQIATKTKGGILRCLKILIAVHRSRLNG